jgi:hypothetical protein
MKIIINNLAPFVGTIQSFFRKRKLQNGDRWSVTPFVKRESGAGPGSHIADLLLRLWNQVGVSRVWALEAEPRAISTKYAE